MAERVAEREYRRHERAVHAMLAGRHPRLAADERSELYQEAWASVLSQRARGRRIETLGPYLLAAADKLAAKRLHCADARRRTAFDPLDGPLAAMPDPAQSPEEIALATDEARRVRLLVEELDDRERAVLELRLDAGLEAGEIRERLGLSERQYRRTAERASRALLSKLAALDGGLWARRQRSLLCACALGLASSRQRERARRLVESDPYCRALMSELRTVARRAAALLPAPAVLADGEGPPAGRWAERVAAARDLAGELLAGAKQHAASLSSRALEATPLAGARPGAATALVAGCLAAGGGTYCAVEGVPDGLKPVFGVERPSKPREKGKKRRPPAPPPERAERTPPYPPEPAGSSALPPARRLDPKPRPRPPAPSPAPAREFEPVSPASTGAPVRAPAPPAGSHPAQAPASPGGSREFGP